VYLGYCEIQTLVEQRPLLVKVLLLLSYTSRESVHSQKYRQHAMQRKNCLCIEVDRIG
jgi:hypothetical protein